jgi:hypothetical protein
MLVHTLIDLIAAAALAVIPRFLASLSEALGDKHQ